MNLSNQKSAIKTRKEKQKSLKSKGATMKNFKNIILAFAIGIASFQMVYAESVDSQLVNVAGNCNLERIKKLVEFGANINAKAGITPLL